MNRLIKGERELDTLAAAGLITLEPAGVKISVGMSTCGLAAGAAHAYELLRDAAEGGRIKRAHVARTGCMGLCQKEPLVEVRTPGRPAVLYGGVAGKNIGRLIEALAAGKALPEMAVCRYGDGRLSDAMDKIPDIAATPFYGRQVKVVLGNCGIINPESIEEYIALEGYRALLKAFEMGPEGVISEIEKSVLRGRGGGGFPAGKKWRACRDAAGAARYIVCNGDEGDPGAFMDRSLMEGDPHAVIEGMTIGAYAVGAHEGVIYVRDEYPLAVKNLEAAISKARSCGLLGKSVAGSAFGFDLRIVRGGGAFVCGEETALIASIEGKRGVPKKRPPYPAESGFRGMPTVINNVETWCNVPQLIRRGAGWFRSMGTEGSPGTKVFALVGKVNNTGLIEVPMGITLRDIVDGMGGGIQDGRAFKAVQTGGPSGGCLPESALDLKIDFDELAREGSMMGSGGMIVMDDRTCMVDVARFFTEFLRGESCGNCTSCRDGLANLHRMLTDMCEGRGTMSGLRLAADLAATIRATSLCALGGTSVNPVLSTMRHFADEYEAHVRDRRCPAHVCRALITYSINDKCNGCHVCARDCPEKCITGEMKLMHEIDQSRCTRCGLCMEVCRFDAVDVD
jgi:NADH:ubiquinone oxidoreductase subunit F (NADH-binding)/(2Fe-2S) ferredoxin/NAD-dependent dihydropyrimidine dehydrogenase PreA subunit